MHIMQYEEKHKAVLIDADKRLKRMHCDPNKENAKAVVRDADKRKKRTHCDTIPWKTQKPS